jgi:hypothetical protein
MDKEPIPPINESRLDFRKTEAHLNYYLDLFGDHIAEREGYRSLSGMNAVHFYIIHTFRWLPKDVKSMSLEDVRLVLTQEMDEYHAESNKKSIAEAMLKGWHGGIAEQAT